MLDALEQPGTYASRLLAAFPSLNEFELTGAADAVRSAIESFGTKYNEVTKRYPAASSDTFPEFTEEDASELAVQLRQVAELTRDAETERILDRLRHHGGVLPEAEIIEARRHQDWFVPHLMRECRDQIAKLKKLDDVNDRLPDDEQNSIPFFSLFLFSEWHVADSIPVILESLRLPGEGPFELYGDGVHEQVPRYLAQFLPDQPEQIDAIVRDSHANTYARWAAANSYTHLVRDQKLSVEDAVERLDRLFSETKIIADDGAPSPEHPDELVSGIAVVISDIGGASHSILSTDAHEWNFIDEGMIRQEEFVEPSRAGVDWEPTNELRRLRPTRVEDCLEELRHWAAFRPRPKPVKRSPAPKPAVRPTPATSRSPLPSSLPASDEPITRAARVPRNAPCPCGSGKKYKQCCLRKQT